MHRCTSWDQDPGPCPVDDTPHTACTPESVGSLTVRVRRPRVLDIPPTPVPQTLAGPPFSTKDYRRKTHRKLVRGD